jgi:hypothetical protein
MEHDRLLLLKQAQEDLSHHPVKDGSVEIANSYYLRAIGTTLLLIEEALYNVQRSY